MIRSFCDWLVNTSLSVAFQNAFWVIPTVQTVHLLAIAVVMTSTVMLNLRLLGLASNAGSIDDVAERFLPWIWSAAVVLLVTGVILIIGEPARELLSQVFWLKMFMLSGALAITAVFQRLMRSDSTFWERRHTIARITAVVSVLLWTAILTAGRWIAYIEHE